MDNFLRAGITFSHYSPSQFAAVYNDAHFRAGGNHEAAVTAVLQFQIALHEAPPPMEEEAALRK
jgi:hypothetical protein